MEQTFNASNGIKDKRKVNGLRACWKSLKAKAKKDTDQERRDTFLLNHHCCKFKFNPSQKFKSEIKLVKQQD